MYISNLKSVTLKLYVCVCVYMCLPVCLFVREFFCLPVKAKMTNLNEVGQCLSSRSVLAINVSKILASMSLYFKYKSAH